MFSSVVVISVISTIAFCDASPARASFGCSNNGITDSDRQAFLDFHNNARRRVAQGVEDNKSGKLNPAKNMYKLEWDCKMEQQLQDAIQSCPGGSAGIQGFSQNVMSWSNSGGFPNSSEKIESTLSGWWSGAKNNGVGSDNKYTGGGLYAFSNMVFSETTKIGCAYKVCGTKMATSCIYNGIGYITNAPMWETGQACKTGADCSTYKNSGCEDSLCTKGADVPETNQQCPSNTGMTDSVRDTFLSLHNGFRSSVARGLEPDALGGNAPKAAKMLKMVYDCEVEASAIRHGNKCVYQHSSGNDRPGLGENIYKTSVQKFEKNKAAKQASELWWNELREFGVGPSNNLTNALWNRPGMQIGHYTQMAWDTTYKLGCAVVFCNDFTFGVCQYGPGGNYMNHLIYTMGQPCSQCAATATCSVTEGLCSAP
uniref:Ancylostoma-secreted protein 1 n=1 Tax=Ancylostoma duodenale TaxID=51022 RepID=O77153_9BILA|nr:ancylostoma-secreted protein 1 precursor [Ancylostoma duodenale]